MNNQNVVVDVDSGSVIPLNSQNANQLTGINTNVSTDTSFFARLLGQDDITKKEIAKIENQIAIITAIAKGNALIATMNENQKKQVILDFARISTTFSDKMTDISEMAAVIKAKKIQQLIAQFTVIFQNAESATYPLPKYKDKVMANAEKDLDERLRYIEDNLFQLCQTRTSITSLQ